MDTVKILGMVNKLHDTARNTKKMKVLFRDGYIETKVSGKYLLWGVLLMS